MPYSAGELEGVYNPVPPRRAKGNLTYLEFISLVKTIWAEAHPDIPLVTSGADDPAKYPCMVYSLQLRKTHPNEPKMRYRETKNENQDAYIIGGQRFQNIVYFSAVGEASHVNTIEALIEIFEDFMMEFTPVFKELGVSELVYARRLSDTEDNRPGAGVVRRTVSYMVTTEKVVSTRYDRLREITVRARSSAFTVSQSTLYAAGTYYNNSPRYHLSGPDSMLRFEITQEAVDEVNQEHDGNFDQLAVRIPQTNFRIGDTLFFQASSQESESPFLQGLHRVTGMVGDPYSLSVAYTLRPVSLDGDEEQQMSPKGPGKGYVSYIVEGAWVTLEDEYKG